jgi:hypothetical protein
MFHRVLYSIVFIGTCPSVIGTTRLPPPLPTFPAGNFLTDSEMDTLEKAQGMWDDYTQREALICSQVLTTIPEGLAMEFQGLKSGKEMWDALCKRHEDKALAVTANIRSRIYVLKCQDSLAYPEYYERAVAIDGQPN